MISMTTCLFHVEGFAVARRSVVARARQPITRNLVLVILLFGGILAFVLPRATAHADTVMLS